MNWRSILALHAKKLNLSQMLCVAVSRNIIWMNSWSKSFEGVRNPGLSFLFSHYWCSLNIPTSGNELKTILIYLHMIINLPGLGGTDTLSVSLGRVLCALQIFKIRTGWKLEFFTYFFFFSQMFAAKLSDKQKYIILSKICSRLNHCWIGAFLTEILKTFYLNQVAAA